MKRERERLLKERAQEKDVRRKARRIERAERLAHPEEPDLAPVTPEDGAPPAESDPVAPA